MIELSFPVFYDSFILPFVEGIIDVFLMLPISHKSVWQLSEVIKKINWQMTFNRNVNSYTNVVSFWLFFCNSFKLVLNP